MHLYIHPECESALKLIRFLKYTTKNTKYYRVRYTCFMIACMKLSSAFYAEAILMVMIIQTNDLVEIVKDFVALGFILEIDNYFAKNSTDR